MNIGLLADCYRPTISGVVTSLLQLKEGLEQRGHRVLVVAPATPHHRETDPAVHQLPSLPFNSASGFRLALVSPRLVRRLVREAPLDLIHTHTEYSLGWAGKRAGQCEGVPLVHTAHTMHEAYRHYLFFGRLVSNRMVQRYLQLFVAGFDAVICPSLKVQNYLRAFVPHLNTTVIENGIAQDRFLPRPLTQEQKHQTRQALGLEAADRVLLYAGRLAREKRVLELLEALAPLLKNDPRCKLGFVGDGPARDRLIQARRHQGLQDQVLLTGRVAWEQMHRFYSIAELFVTASLSEVQPLTLIEASICGLPIIARRDEGYIGLVEEGYNGYLADSDRHMAGLAATLLGDEEQRRSFSRHALVQAERFTAERQVASMEALYRELIQGQRRDSKKPLPDRTGGQVSRRGIEPRTR